MSSACCFIFMQINYFHENSFALRLALKQRHKATRKLPIAFHFASYSRRDFLKHKTVKTNDKIRRFGVVMTPLSRTTPKRRILSFLCYCFMFILQ